MRYIYFPNMPQRLALMALVVASFNYSQSAFEPSAGFLACVLAQRISGQMLTRAVRQGSLADLWVPVKWGLAMAGVTTASYATLWWVDTSPHRLVNVLWAALWFWSLYPVYRVRNRLKEST